MPTMQTTDDLRAEWAERGDELTAAHIQAHPGSRPPGWWSFSAPEPRRRRIGTMQLRNGIDPDAQVHALGSTGPKARFDRANYEFVAATDAVHPFDNPERRKHVERASKRPEAHTNFAADAYSLDCGIPAVLCVMDDFRAVFESEVAYLLRHNLIAADEMAAMEKLDIFEKSET